MNTSANISGPGFDDGVCQVMLSPGMLSQIMEELETAFPRWQAALLRGGLSEFQECTRGLEALARGLQEEILHSKLAAASVSAEARDLSALAKSLHEQARVFLATLRRIRRMLEARSQALAGCSRLYAPPAADTSKAAV